MDKASFYTPAMHAGCKQDDQQHTSTSRGTKDQTGVQDAAQPLPGKTGELENQFASRAGRHAIAGT
eukprot:61800-Prorocentrum_lima.AAC.1